MSKEIQLKKSKEELKKIRIKRLKKISRIVLCISIPSTLYLSYLLYTSEPHMSAEEYKRINVDERQYKKDNINKLVKSSSEEDYYVDIYRGKPGYFVVDFYSSVDYKNIDIGLSDWGGPIDRAEQLSAEDIDIEWGKKEDKIIYVRISVKEGDKKVQPITIYTVFR